MEYKLSASTLNLLRECPRCFWLTLVKKIKRPSGPVPSIAVKMDSIIKHYFDKYREIEELPPIILNQVEGKLAMKMPKTLRYQEKNDILLWGRPDEYLELIDGSIVALDHKTKSKLPEKMHPSYFLQLDVYSYLIKMNGYPTTDKAYLAFYYPDESVLHQGMDVTCKLIVIKTNPNRVVKYIQKAFDVLNGQMPGSGKDCEFCRWIDEISNVRNFSQKLDEWIDDK